MQNVYLVNSLKFPNGDAGSIRVLGFAKALKYLGYVPYVVTMGVEPETESVIDGVEYKSFRQTNKRKNCFLSFLKLFYWLYQKRRNIDVIIGYGTNLLLIVFLKIFCRLFHIIFICDVVEWYSKSQFKRPYLSCNYLQKNLLNRCVLTKKDRIIAISRYLEMYFSGRGCRTVRIPIFFEIFESEFNKKNHGRLTLIYAGSPGKKDFLYEMLAGISLLSPCERQHIHFIIIGISESNLRTNFGAAAYDTIKANLHVTGRLNRQDVLDYYQKADFAVLLRNPESRVSKAGFPSKVPECMCHYTPMICNYSSDLKDYLVDGKNSLICDDYTAESFKRTITRALALHRGEIKKMSVNAYQTSVQYFNILSNQEAFINILN